jgi:translocation and assembly module TamA
MGGRGATSGTVADLTGEGFQARLDGSATALGSRSTFLRLYLRDEHRQALGENWRWTWRGELGTTLVRNFDSLPSSYRYFAGGDRSVRGFALNELGPRDAAGLRTGAKHLLVTSLELERKLPRQLAMAVFVDAGDAFNTWQGGVAASVGIGLRYRLPMLNLGLDLAQAVHAPGNGTLPGPRVHLNLSPAF